MKIINRMLFGAMLLVPAAAQAGVDEMTKAVEMVATFLVYQTECKPSDEIIKQMAATSRLYMDAAGINSDNRQFFALVTIKAADYGHEAKTTPNFCKLMTAAYEKGRSE